MLLPGGRCASLVLDGAGALSIELTTTRPHGGRQAAWVDETGSLCPEIEWEWGIEFMVHKVHEWLWSTLKTTRDFLLPRQMSGEIGV